MTSTNYATANYWAKQGAARVVLARELNMEQVLAFKEHAELAVEVQVHGITNIYHSKRELVKNYMEHQGKDAATRIVPLSEGFSSLNMNAVINVILYMKIAMARTL